jgi:hypothetical protein
MGMHKKLHDPWHVAVKPDPETVCRLTGKTREELHGMKYWAPLHRNARNRRERGGYAGKDVSGVPHAAL